jgi:hypothetical protein
MIVDVLIAGLARLVRTALRTTVSLALIKNVTTRKDWFRAFSR